MQSHDNHWEGGRESKKKEEEGGDEIYSNHTKFLNKPWCPRNIGYGTQSSHRAHHAAPKQSHGGQHA